MSTGKSVWLFNITADPYERVDLSNRYPGIVKKLLRRLSQFNKTAVPVRYPPKTPEVTLGSMEESGGHGIKRKPRKRSQTKIGLRKAKEKQNKEEETTENSLR